MTSSADVNREIPVSIPKLDSPDLSYDIASYAHSLPRTIRILREDGKATDTIQATDVEMKFKIPVGTYNLAKSILRYSWAPSAGSGAGTHQRAPADLLPIRQIRLATQEGGTIMADLMYADHYTRIVPKAETSLEKFLTHDSLDSVFPCNEEAKSNLPGPAAETSSVNYLEPKYFHYRGVDGNPIAANVALPIQHKSVELQTFKNTLFDLDKMVYYPEPLELTIWFQQRSHWLYTVTDLNSMSAGAADGAVDITMTNIELHMRQESDPTVDEECKRAVLNAPADAPFTLYVPVVTPRKMQSLVGTNSGVQIQLGTQMGTRLTKVYAIPIANAESKNVRYDSRNFAANGAISKVTRYQTKFNALNVQPNAVNVANREDWFIARDLLKGTAIMNSSVYGRNWFILDDYSGITEDTKSMYPPGKHNLVTGRKLQLGDSFELVTECVADLQWYIFFVGQRVLRIAPLGKGGIGYV